MSVHAREILLWSHVNFLSLSSAFFGKVQDEFFFCEMVFKLFSLTNFSNQKIAATWITWGGKRKKLCFQSTTYGHKTFLVTLPGAILFRLLFFFFGGLHCFILPYQPYSRVWLQKKVGELKKNLVIILNGVLVEFIEAHSGPEKLKKSRPK